MNNQVWEVESVDMNGLAYNMGISAGDRPIEINGQTADDFLNKYEKNKEFSAS